MRQHRSPTLPLMDHPLPFYCLLLAAAIPKPESHFFGSARLLDTSGIRALPADPPCPSGLCSEPMGEALQDAGSVPAAVPAAGGAFLPFTAEQELSASCL